MGNQPSSPTQPPASIQPLAPVCDAACHKQQLLTGLKTTLDQKEQTQSEDPSGYEQARIAYYTALNGDEWLVKEKTRISTDDVSPKITEYTTQYNDLKTQQSSQQVFVNMMNGLQTQEIGDEQDLHFLKKQLESEKDKASVLNRLTVLGTQPVPSINYIPILLDIVLAFLGIGVLYLLYNKFSTIKGYFGYTDSSVIMGGKRLRK